MIPGQWRRSRPSRVFCVTAPQSLASAALLVVLAASAPAAARAGGPDVVQVGGGSFRGTIVETRPGVHVRLRLDDGSEVTVPWSEVVAIDGSAPPRVRTTPPPSPPAPSTEGTERWYGWQTLAADGA